MAQDKRTVAEKRRYLITSVTQAKEITTSWLADLDLEQAISLGLPEVDDRYHIWRVPLRKKRTTLKVGEVVLDAYTTEILGDKTTRPQMIEARLLGKDEEKTKSRRKKARAPQYPISEMRNTIGLGDTSDLIESDPPPG